MHGLEPEYSGRVDFIIIDVGKDREHADLVRHFRAEALPTVVVIDGSGTTLLREVNIRDEESYRNKLVEALEEASG